MAECEVCHGTVGAMGQHGYSGECMKVIGRDVATLKREQERLRADLANALSCIEILLSLAKRQPRRDGDSLGSAYDRDEIADCEGTCYAEALAQGMYRERGNDGN